MRSRHRPSLAVPLAMLTWTSGCSLDETTPVPDCHEAGSIVIAAQSVAEARFVPCIDDPGSGWHATTVHIDQDGTTIQFALGLQGAGAELSFTGSCDGEGAPIDAGVAGVDASVVDSTGRRYRFDGGCVVIVVDRDAAAVATEALIESVVLLERARLADDLGRAAAEGGL